MTGKLQELHLRLVNAQNAQAEVEKKLQDLNSEILELNNEIISINSSIVDMQMTIATE